MASTPACHAADQQLSFAPNGDVFVCCVSQQRLGNVAQDSLQSLWEGAQRLGIASDLRRSVFPANCAGCEIEVATEGRQAAFPAQFDYLGHAPTSGASRHWPSRLDFMLSNRCNLQCVQCSGDLSSAIRKHREGRPALPRSYADEFFEQLAEFIPHLRYASFEGGEPFLAPENYRVWDLLTQHAPEVLSTVCTNGTRCDDKVIGVLSDLPVDLIVSIDGYSAATFESSRVGASRDEVFANVERFAELLTTRGRRLSINHCLMPHNLTEFPDLLLWAESLGLPVNVSVVRSPREHSLQFCTAGELESGIRALEAREREIRFALDRNLAVWNTELERLRVWHGQAGRGSSVSVRSGQSLLGFASVGDVSPADSNARDWVAAGASNAEMARLVVDQQERIIQANAAAGVLFGIGAADLVGSPVARVNELVSGYVERVRGVNWVGFGIEVDGRRCRGANLVVRDQLGVAQSGVILVSPVA
jgi:radical SAM protein with 4Fe4S-binding SPASM domain